MSGPTILGVDVSSNNPVRTQAQVDEWVGEGCQVLLVKSYSHIEIPGLDQTTREWCAFARAAGLWHLPFMFLYASADPGDQVRSSLTTWRSAGEVPGVLVLDCEEYQDDIGGPSVEQILAAVDACRAEKINVIGYSRWGWLDSHRDQRLAVIPWWLADYNGQPTLDIDATRWCQVIGHQYRNDGPDWSVWDLAALQALAAGYVAPDPCKLYKDALRAASASLAALRGHLADLDGEIEAEQARIDGVLVGSTT